MYITVSPSQTKKRTNSLIGVLYRTHSIVLNPGTEIIRCTQTSVAMFWCLCFFVFRDAGHQVFFVKFVVHP